MKGPKPDYKLKFESAVTSLRIAYNEYAQAQIKYLQHTSIGPDGEFIVSGNSKELRNKIEETALNYEKKFEEVRLLRALNELETYFSQKEGSNEQAENHN